MSAPFDVSMPEPAKTDLGEKFSTLLGVIVDVAPWLFLGCLLAAVLMLAAQALGGGGSRGFKAMAIVLAAATFFSGSASVVNIVM